MAPKVFQSTIENSLVATRQYNQLAGLSGPKAKVVEAKDLIADLRAAHYKYSQMLGDEKAQCAESSTKKGKWTSQNKGHSQGEHKGKEGTKGTSKEKDAKLNDKMVDCVCYNCRRKGHYAKKCPLKKHQKSQHANEASDNKNGKDSGSKGNAKSNVAASAEISA